MSLVFNQIWLESLQFFRHILLILGFWCLLPHIHILSFLWLQVFSCQLFCGFLLQKPNLWGTGDSTQLPELVEQTSQNFNVKEYSADKAYSGRENLKIIDSKNATPFIPFRNNAKPRAGGVSIWKRMFHYFNLHQDEFMEHYHARSNVETTFFMVKSKLGDSVKSKNFTAQKNELLCKLIAHNIIVLIQEIHELGIEVNFCTKSNQPARLVAQS